MEISRIGISVLLSEGAVSQSDGVWYFNGIGSALGEGYICDMRYFEIFSFTSKAVLISLQKLLIHFL